MKAAAILAVLLAAPLAAQTPEKVMCSRDGARPVACTVAITTSRDGKRILDFNASGTKVRIIGKAQSGWWSGTLDGKPAMGIELNRGYTRFSTSDLATTFDWFYPGQQHGTY